jgi:hypothetical protein
MTSRGRGVELVSVAAYGNDWKGYSVFRGLDTPRRMTTHPIKIISGGQTGADRAALDWALSHGVPHGGWCPCGHKAENGLIPPRYNLTETRSTAYLLRTRWNVRDSDGTAIFSLESRLSGGTQRAAEIAAKLKKPLLVLARTTAIRIGADGWTNSSCGTGFVF